LHSLPDYPRLSLLSQRTCCWGRSSRGYHYQHSYQ
jgi:hypothetical protein